MNNNDIVTLIQKVSALGIDSLEYHDDELTLKIQGKSVNRPAQPIRQSSQVPHSSDISGGTSTHDDANTFDIAATGCGYFHTRASGFSGLTQDAQDSFDADQIVGFVRVGGVLTPLRAPRQGRLVKFLVAEGEQVEYGQPVFSCR
ncbi:acetyl-CoA carboxylase biotin carboxyl carrier protein [Halomonas sp.]|uniref:acetyl-CoA carboxylase biotin carboxyl carrier protein n=1 Tax=Halomonas sp. TaxID=1486246 RepID=UPI003A8E3BDA